MYRISVQYGRPADPKAFDDHYTNVHIPLAKKLPNLRGLAVSKGDSLDGSTPDVYQVAELYFDSKEDAGAALASPAGVAANEDLANFAPEGAAIVFTEINEIAL